MPFFFLLASISLNKCERVSHPCFGSHCQNLPASSFWRLLLIITLWHFLYSLVVFFLSSKSGNWVYSPENSAWHALRCSQPSCRGHCICSALGIRTPSAWHLFSYNPLRHIPWAVPVLYSSMIISTFLTWAEVFLHQTYIAVPPPPPFWCGDSCLPTDLLLCKWKIHVVGFAILPLWSVGFPISIPQYALDVRRWIS